MLQHVLWVLGLVLRVEFVRPLRRCTGRMGLEAVSARRLEIVEMERLLPLVRL